MVNGGESGSVVCDSLNRLKFVLPNQFVILILGGGEVILGCQAINANVLQLTF